MTGAHAAGVAAREADSASASAVKAMQAEGRHAGSTRAVRGPRRPAPAAGLADRVPLPAGRRGSGRSGAGRVRQGVLAPGVVPRGAAVRGLVHPDPDQRVPGPDQGANAPRALAGVGARAGARASRISRIASPAAARRPRIRSSRRERRQKLADALARLPERQRSVFMLSHYEGCTSREVSALTGLNESTVRVHLFRAIRRLRTLLADDGQSAARSGRDHRRQTSCPSLVALGRRRHHLDDDAIAALWSPASPRRATSGRRSAPCRASRRACADCRARLRRVRRLARRTRAPTRSTKPTRSSRPSAWPRSRRRSSAASKRSNARRGSSPSRDSAAPAPSVRRGRSAGSPRPPRPA